MSRPFRVLLISGEYPPMEGGVADFARLLGAALVALGAEVHVLTSAKATDMNSQDVEARKGAETNPQTPNPSLRCHPLMHSWSWCPLYSTMSRLLEELSPDVVNIQYQTAAYAMHPAINLLPWVAHHILPGPARACPFVVTFHDLLVPYLFPKAGRVRWTANLALARSCKGVIVTNIEDQERLSSYPWMPRLELIPIGSNIPCVLPDDYDRTQWRRRWGIGEEILLLCYFGFLNASKGGEDLIAALDSLCRSGQRVSLLMIGGAVGASDPTNQAYLDLVKRSIRERGLEGKVIWTGYMSPEEVSASFRSADLCVLPYRDGASFRRGSFMAALAHGMPIVTTGPVPFHPTISGKGDRPTHPHRTVPQLRDGENILLVPPQDPRALSVAIIRLANDAGLRRRLGEGAQALAREFEWEHIAARTLEVFHELAGH